MSDASTELSMKLIERWKDGDEAAASEIFERYVARLIALAASRISPGLARRVEAEDVVQSVYKSFFSRTRENTLKVESGGQLWSLLAAITINKVRSKARFHGADRRNVGAESSVNSSSSCHGVPPMELTGEPTADEVVEIQEQYTKAMAKLSPVGQSVFELYLANEPVDTIAEKVRRSARTVRRELETARKLLSNMLTDAIG